MAAPTAADVEAAGPPVATGSARVMGTTADVVLVDPGAVSPDDALHRLADLERRWSRFLPEAELGRCGPGWSVVSAETATLVERMAWAWEVTGGRFDPTVGPSLAAAGYDRDLDRVRSGPPRRWTPRPAPGAAGVTADVATGLVHLASGVSLDPGGCGKGLAADLAALEAVDAGARGALVSVGGDLRVAGTPPPGGWPVEVDHLVGPPLTLRLRDGGLATSSVLRRRWDVLGPDDRPRTVHHVLDPRTGRSTGGTLVSVTVVAGEAWLAEVLATALLVSDGGSVGPADRCWGHRAGALLTRADGRREVVGTFPPTTPGGAT